MSEGLVTAAYIGAIILFILALGGLSHPETSRRGNAYGITGMAIAVVATVFGPEVSVIAIIMVCMLIGGTIGFILALKVQMTQMPELVAILHSLVGVAAVLVGFVNFMDPDAALHFSGTEKTIHNIETYLGVLIGAVTFSGSVIAFGKLSAKISGKPVLLPARHWLNLGLLIGSIWLCFEFVDQAETGGGMIPLLIMTAIALTFGIHMVMAIGGADMPVVICRSGHRVYVVQ
jgi:NAD(P) transhydrogenase subunit beta